MHMDERPDVSSGSGSAQMRETNQRTGRRRADQESDTAVGKNRGTGHSQRGCELETEAEDERHIWDAVSDGCHGWCDTAERVRGVCARGVDGGAEEIARAVAGVLDGDLRTEDADAELDGREGDARRLAELLEERLGGVRLIRARGEAGDEGGGVGFALWGRWPCRMAGAEGGSRVAGRKGEKVGKEGEGNGENEGRVCGRGREPEAVRHCAHQHQETQHAPHGEISLNDGSAAESVGGSITLLVLLAAALNEEADNAPHDETPVGEGSDAQLVGVPIALLLVRHLHLRWRGLSEKRRRRRARRRGKGGAREGASSVPAGVRRGERIGGGV
ncbi:hypothetical protein FB451DRAFT_1187560 [Mycena latifolia]|nr:hypothetical protein FB451DRAFT_1187560 [Mycena latifolia]